MFVGHVAVALAARTTPRAPSLVWFVAAANLVDLIWPLLLILGVERVRIDPGNTAFTPLDFVWYPWTHSLLMGVMWGGALGALARWRGVSSTGSWLIGLVVVSHWVLDLVTHRPDLPLWPWAPGFHGLGLWHSVAATFAVEGALWIAAIVCFLRTVRLQGAQGVIAFWSFVFVSTLIWASGPFSPPPPDERALAQFALAGWLFVPWAWWIERNAVAR